MTLGLNERQAPTRHTATTHERDNTTQVMSRGDLRATPSEGDNNCKAKESSPMAADRGQLTIEKQRHFCW